MTKQLMEAVVERENMLRAMRSVEANKGSAGVDNMPVEALRPWLREHWPRLKEQLLAASYEPQPVRGVQIPKPGGKGMRQLGIPTVVDRLIQQAFHQVMQPLFDGEFSKSSYGFRPGRNAHQAVQQAQAYVSEGRQWKRPLARAKNLMKRGLTEERAWISACNGHGPWWNAGAAHMNEAFPKRAFDQVGLVSLLDHLHRLQRAS